MTASSFPRMRFSDGVLLAVGLLLLAGVFAHQVGEILGARAGCDFDDYYYATKVFRFEGASLYDFQAKLALASAEGRSCNFYQTFYPPYLNLVFLPWVGFRYESVRVFWLLVNYGLLFATMPALRRLCQESTGARPGWRLTWLLPLWALALFSPLVDHNWQGQANLLILCPLTWGIRYEMRGSVRRGGLLIAAAALLKLFPFVLLPCYVVTRRFRTVAWILAGIVLTTAVTLVFIPLSEFLRFPSLLLGTGYAAGTEWWWGNLSASNVIAGVLPQAAPSGSRLNLLLRLIPYAAVLGLCAREPEAGSARLIRIAQLVTLFGFFLGIWWEHHLVLLVFPFYVAFHEALRARPVRRLPLWLAIASGVYIGAIYHPMLREGLSAQWEALEPYKFAAILMLLAALELLAHPPLRPVLTSDGA